MNREFCWILKLLDKFGCQTRIFKREAQPQPALVVENPPEVLKGKMAFWHTVGVEKLCTG